MTVDEVAAVRRRGGRVREVVTTGGRSYLVAELPGMGPLLVVGAPIGEAEERLLTGEAASAAARDIAQRLLAVRDRSEGEIRAGLASRGVSSPAAIEETLCWLRERGLVDDRRLALETARYLSGRKLDGPGKIRARLRRARVDDAAIDAAIEALPRGWQLEAAETLARSRIAGPADRRTVRRVSGLLSRRGYGGGIVGEICSRIMRGELKETNDER
ncbi:MAG: regulatory protein RecX [Candidatus Krumholzibacteriota bacterium]|nr:regulatory protein RecX [Candidatus Krumholzibacteriota bacterium]